MSEVRQKLEEIQQEETKIEEPEYTEAEQEAMAEGWKPGGHDKDGNELSADEYMARKPLFNKIKNLTDKVSELSDTLQAVQTDSKKMAQTFIKEKEGLLEQLKVKKEQALTDLDADAVREIDKQIDQVQATTQEVTQVSKQDATKSLIKFVKENPWYDTNPGKKLIADGLWDAYVEQNPQTTPEQAFSHVTSEMKAEFPELYETKQERPSGSKVSSVSRRATGQKNTKKQVTLDDITDHEERQIIQVMANAVGKPVEEYMKTYKLED